MRGPKVRTRHDQKWTFWVKGMSSEIWELSHDTPAIERSEVADLPMIYVDFARWSGSGNSNIHGADTASPRRNNSERVITFHRNSLPRNKNKRILEDITKKTQLIPEQHKKKNKGKQRSANLRIQRSVRLYVKCNPTLDLRIMGSRSRSGSRGQIRDILHLRDQGTDEPQVKDIDLKPE